MDGARVSEILASLLLIFTDRYVSVAGGEIQMENRNWKITGEMFFSSPFFYQTIFIRECIGRYRDLVEFFARVFRCARHLKAFGPLI